MTASQSALHAFQIAARDNAAKLLGYMEHNFGALSEAELVEALGNHIERICPDMTQADANLFIAYARIALHTGSPDAALLFLMSQVTEVGNTVEAAQQILDALLSQITEELN